MTAHSDQFINDIYIPYMYEYVLSYNIQLIEYICILIYISIRFLITMLAALW